LTRLEIQNRSESKAKGGNVKMKEKYDFSGWATKNNVKCADGRTIKENAFMHNNGQTVPLVWNHQHNAPEEVLGHALLENRPEGVYAYCAFNDTEAGKNSKLLVQHGDVTALSIYANQLKQKGSDVLHGAIREVSLVLAGANPEAYIDAVSMSHSDDNDNFEAVIYSGEEIFLEHSDETPAVQEPVIEKETIEMDGDIKKPDATLQHADDGEETVQDVFDSLNEKQKTVVYAMIGAAIEDAGTEDSTGGDNNMKQNAFDQNNNQETNNGVLSHSAQGEILALAKSSGVGSLKQALEIYAKENELAHGDISGFVQTGTGNVANLFPEYVDANGNGIPTVITNDMGWVDAIMLKTSKIPHGRVRTSHVDIRNIDALNAKGYVKGTQKKIVGNYTLVRRTTDPQTVYVTSELHRDDVVDIEDFDYVQFQYNIDQISLKETLAVATMLGDDRGDSDPEKIFPEHIRPIWKDDELYTIHKDIDFAAMAAEIQGTDATKNFGDSFVYAEAMVTALRMARKDFRGTGKPDLFISTDMHNTMILARDRNGRRIYETDTELAAALGVANIYEVTQFEGRERTDADSKKHKLHAIAVNMNDYGYGASKGGDVTHFTDFDIKFNQLQSLLETRKSGQLTRIKSAIVIEELVTTP